MHVEDHLQSSTVYFKSPDETKPSQKLRAGIINRDIVILYH